MEGEIHFQDLTRPKVKAQRLKAERKEIDEARRIVIVGRSMMQERLDKVIPKQLAGR